MPARTIAIAERLDLAGRLSSWLLFAVLIVPLIVVPWLVFPFVTGKALVFRALTESLVPLLILLAAERRLRPGVTPIGVAALAFLIATLIADLTGIDPTRSLFSSLERMDGFIGLLHLAVYFFALSLVFRSHGQWRRYLAVSTAIATLVAVMGMLGGPYGRLAGSLSNPDYLGAFAFAHIFIAAFLVRSATTLRQSLTWLATMPPLLAALYLSGSRAGFVALLGGGLAALALEAPSLLARLRARRWERGTLGVAFLAPVLLLALAIHWLPSLDTGHAPLPLSQDPRLSIWRSALSGVAERPILGWGEENFDLVFDRFFPPGIEGREERVDRAHNIILDTLVSGGTVALIAYGSALLLMLRTYFRHWRQPALRYLFAAGIAYLINSLFSFDDLASATSLVALLAYAQVIDGSTAAEARQTGAPIGIGRPIWAASLIAMPVIVAISNIPVASAAFWLQRAMFADDLEEWQRATRAALRNQGPYDAEIAVILGERSIALLSDPSLLPEARARIFDSVEPALARAQRLRPDSALIPSIRGRLTLLAGRPAEALALLKTAEVLSPARQSILFDEFRALEALGRTEDALATAQRAFDLDPHYEDSQRILSTARQYASDQGKR